MKNYTKLLKTKTDYKKIKLIFKNICALFSATTSLLFLISCSQVAPESRAVPVEPISQKDNIVISKADYKRIEKNTAQLAQDLSELKKVHQQTLAKHQQELHQKDQKIAALKTSNNLLQQKLNASNIDSLTKISDAPLALTSTQSSSAQQSKKADSFNAPENSPDSLNDTAPSQSNLKPPAKVADGIYITDHQDPDLIEPENPLSLLAAEGAQIDYTKAYGIYLKGEYANAIRRFSDFLDNYPTDPYAHNAEYWLGMSYYNINRFNLAEHHFRKVLKNFLHKNSADGYKTPDAIYMLGSIHEKREDLDKSNYYYWKVIELFPKTVSASNARLKLRTK